MAQFSTPRTVFGGSIIKNGYGNHPEEVYVCPRGFDGDYTVRIATIYTNPEKPPTRLTLETITHEGTPEETKDDAHARARRSPGEAGGRHAQGRTAEDGAAVSEPRGDRGLVVRDSPGSRTKCRVKNGGNPRRPMHPRRRAAMPDPTPQPVRQRVPGRIASQGRFIFGVGLAAFPETSLAEAEDVGPRLPGGKLLDSQGTSRKPETGQAP